MPTLCQSELPIRKPNLPEQDHLDMLVEELGNIGRFIVKQDGPLFYGKLLNHFIIDRPIQR